MFFAVHNIRHKHRITTYPHKTQAQLTTTSTLNLYILYLEGIEFLCITIP